MICSAASSTTSPEFFESMYRRNPDPWNFAADPYETQRYDAILAALAGRRFRRAFEPGCSVGVLTERLALIADAVEASDISPSAVAEARKRCAALQNVTLTTASLSTADLGRFDLVVLSEIGYYFSLTEWSEIAKLLTASMQPGATLLAAHWLGHSPDHPISGDDVHRILQAVPQLQLDHAERHEFSTPQQSFRLDRFTRVVELAREISRS